MSQCPVCSNDIPESFGIVECSNCKTMLVADMSGMLQVADSDPSVIKEITKKLDAEAAAEISTDEKPNIKSENEWDFSLNKETSTRIVAKKIEDAVHEAEAKTVIQEIQDFANSEDAGLRQGEYFYNLTIHEVFSQDLKDELEFVLTDPKLKINLDGIDFKSDSVNLKKLNPVKLSVVVSKIKHLPIKIEWTQFSIIQGEV